MVNPIVTADSPKHKHLEHTQPNQSQETEAEISRLVKLFGEHSPQLSARQFAESLQSATPVTQSLFRQFYAEDGAWGKFLKKYHIPHRRYEAEAYIPSVFGRLYINKDEERRILYAEHRGEHGNGLTSQLVDTPVFPQLMRHPLLGMRQIFATTRLSIGTYYNYRRFDRVRTTFSEDTTLGALASIRDQLVNSTIPRLFQVTAFRDCCLNILYRRVYRHINPNLWEQLLRPAKPSLITEIVQSTASTTELIERLGHRGPQEYELAAPRWAEIQTDLLALYNSVSFSAAHLGEVAALRQSIIERFASSWDKQMVETHFLLYDYYYDRRERVHDEWIHGLTRMRRILLELDTAARLDGLIWYASLEEIFTLYPELDTAELKRRRNQHNEFKAINLPTELAGETWLSLINDANRPASTDAYPVRRLVGGRAMGICGTVEDLKNDKNVSILVVKSLDPSLVIYFNQIKGIVAETGGLLSHGAILAREFGIPAVILAQATNVIQSKTHITLNATDERIEIQQQD